MISVLALLVGVLVATVTATSIILLVSVRSNTRTLLRLEILLKRPAVRAPIGFKPHRPPGGDSTEGPGAVEQIKAELELGG